MIGKKCVIELIFQRFPTMKLFEMVKQVKPTREQTQHLDGKTHTDFIVAAIT